MPGGFGYYNSVTIMLHDMGKSAYPSKITEFWPTVSSKPLKVISFGELKYTSLRFRWR